MDKRRLAVLAVIAAFMVVPIAHVAAYTGSLERDGWQWVGWFYAVGVDASIAVCAWFTRWQTTRRPSVFGYVLFSLMDGAFNIGYLEPWERPSPIAAWAYALLPTAAVIVLGWLIRDVGKFSKRKGTADAETARIRASLKETRAELARAHTEMERARAETEQIRAELTQKSDEEILARMSKKDRIIYLANVSEMESQARIAQVANCSEGYVSKVLASLTDLGKCDKIDAVTQAM